MDAKGLMVGDYLKNEGVIVQIDARSIFDMFNDNPKYEPIELTEQWLFKFGFGTVKSIPGSYYRQGFRFHSQRPGNTEGFLWNTETYYWDRDILVKNGIKYVHQLQNLFFALTATWLIAR